MKYALLPPEQIQNGLESLLKGEDGASDLAGKLEFKNVEMRY